VGNVVLALPVNMRLRFKLDPSIQAGLEEQLPYTAKDGHLFPQA
jgi:hypothetical protein